jgi:hypothetical protein
VTNAKQAQRRTTATDWATQNPVLDAGEMGFETDTRIYKVGDGTTAWKQLKKNYAAAKLFNAKGDLITRGNIAEELFTNNAMNVDTNNDGVADGWTAVGSDHTHMAVSSSGQTLTSVAGQTTAITRSVKVEPGYTYNFNFWHNLLSLGSNSSYQAELIMQLFSDAALTTPVDVPFIDSHSTSTTPLGVNHDFVNGLTFDAVGYVLITLKVYSGASILYTSMSFTRNHSDLITLPTTGAVPGSTLYVDAQGALKWTTTSQTDRMAPYITSTDMASTYKTKSAAATGHAQFLQATDAATTYESIANANIAHALHQYSAAAATDYHTPASLLSANYEPKDEIHVKTADTTITNQAAYTAVPDLSFAMEANATYLFELFLIVSGTTANGLRLSVIAATSSSHIFGVHSPVNGAGGSTGNIHQAVTTGTGASPGTQSCGVAGVGVPLFATLRGTVFNSATAGSFAFSMAQNTAAASTSATIQAGSFIRAIKIA